MHIKQFGGSMKTFNYTITDPVGMHVRPAGKLVALAKTFASSISISGNGKQADCKRMIALTSLGIKHNDTIQRTKKPRQLRFKPSFLRTYRGIGSCRYCAAGDARISTKSVYRS